MDWTLCNWVGDQKVYDAIIRAGIMEFEGSLEVKGDNLDVWELAQPLFDLGMDVMIRKIDGRTVLYVDNQGFRARKSSTPKTNLIETRYYKKHIDPKENGDEVLEVETVYIKVEHRKYGKNVNKYYFSYDKENDQWEDTFEIDTDWRDGWQLTGFDVVTEELDKLAKLAIDS